MTQGTVPNEVGGLAVCVACPEDRFLLLSHGDGMHVPGRGAVQAFRSLAVCADSHDSGGVFVFKCGPEWRVLGDDWYINLDEALVGIEAQYPGILQNLVRLGQHA